MSVIGLDIGTTRIKAMLFDEATVRSRCVAVATPVTSSAHGDLRDADWVAREAIDCITTLLSTVPRSERSRIEGIGVASLSEEVVLVDESGRSVTALPTWYTTVMEEESDIAGMDRSFSWSKLRWARMHLTEPERARVRGMTTLCSHVAGHLSGERSVAIDYSHASRTGFFDVVSSRWSVERFLSTGWSAELLPPLVSSGACVGRVAPELREQWGMATDATVAVAGHDHLCAAFAAGVREPGQMFLSSGTSEAHVLISGDAAPLLPSSPVQVGRHVDGRSFYLHAQLPSGHLHAHLEQLVGGQERLATLEAQALLEPVGAGGLEFTPNVGADPGYSVRGLSARAGAAAFLRATQEGLAVEAYVLDRQLEDISGTRAVAVIATGAATSNALWGQIRGAMGVAPLEIVEDLELTALGAAHVFLWGTRGAAPPPARREAARRSALSNAHEYEQLLSRRIPPLLQGEQ